MTSSASIILTILLSFVALAQAGLPYWPRWDLHKPFRRFKSCRKTESCTVNGRDGDILIGLRTSIQRCSTKHYWNTTTTTGKGDGTQTMVSQVPSGKFALKVQQDALWRGRNFRQSQVCFDWHFYCEGVKHLRVYCQLFCDDSISNVEERLFSRYYLSMELKIVWFSVWSEI